MLQLINIGKFYATSRSIGSIDLLDFILQRYSSVGFVMEMEATLGLELIVHAIKKDRKDRLFNQWLHDPARYEVGFDEYIKQATPYRKSTEEEKEEILRKFGGVRNGTV